MSPLAPPTNHDRTFWNSAGEFCARTEVVLDSKGKGAWIALMVLGFIVAWPVGLAILAYMIWSKRMFSTHRTGVSYKSRRTGNSAFDNYKAETLRRLEDEQAAFETFLERLRRSKDQAEFDRFMEDRARNAKAQTGGDAPIET